MSNLRSVRITNTAITVEWDSADSPSVCGPLLYYNVTIVNLVDPSNMNSTQETGNRAEFPNLNNGTSYNISVAAVNRVGTGPVRTFNETTLSENQEGELNAQYSCTIFKAYIPYSAKRWRGKTLANLANLEQFAKVIPIQIYIIKL